MQEGSPPDDDRTVVEGHDPGEGGDSHAGRIGPYRLIRELGRGGMGEVWLAEQLEPVQRQVALKVISGRHPGGTAGALFEVERQMLARMHHPAIAQVFDAGTTGEGCPWFAMEWVRGEPVLEHCRIHRLGVNDRLQLFIRICQGIQHAHQQGVIHRDIKPGNILVDRVDEASLPRIIDFGVATGVVEGEGGPRSDTTDRAGTRGYMSPELIAGPASEVDTRTDVYSLGVLLYEMLTDQRPPPADATAALERVRHELTGTSTSIRGGTEGESGTQFTAGLHLPREMRWILARSLAPERSERYDSAAALAADLRRYLANEVVEAVPATRAYRWRKFLARNRLAVGTVSAVTLALVAGLVTAVYGLLEARAQADRAEQIAGFTTRMLSSIDPEFADGADTPVLDRVLADAAERVETELADQPSIRAEIELTIGKVYAGLGNFERAREHLRAVASGLDADDQPALYLDAGIELALIDSQEAHNQQALEDVNELLDIARAGQPELRLQWLELLSVKGGLYQQLTRFDEAIEILDQVIREIEGERDGELQRLRITTMRNLGQTYSEMHRLDDADHWFARALEAARSWEDPVSKSLELGLLNDRGVLLLRREQYAEAEPLLREGVEESIRLYGEGHPEVIVKYGNLAGSIRQQGPEHVEESLPYYEKARELAVARYGPDHPQSVAFTYNLGNAYLDLERTDESLAMHREALARKDNFPQNHVIHGLVYLGLGKSELASGNAAAAREHLIMAVDRLAELVGEDFHRRIEAMQYLADTLEVLGENGRAVSLREQAASLRSEDRTEE